MNVEVQLADEGKEPYRALIRPGTVADRAALVRHWAPVLTRGPSTWLDRDWPWETFGETDLAFDCNPEWLVLVDELASEARGDVLGVLVTTVPVSAREASLDDPSAAPSTLLWLEYIAIAPGLRPDCPARDRRSPVLKGVGVQLMLRAICRSEDQGLGGQLALHAEGEVACSTYGRWKMRPFGDAAHPAGGRFPVFLGDSAWAQQFRADMERRQR